MNAAPVYDLILQGGHIICPASGIDGVTDVAIADGKIAQVAKSIIPSSAKSTIDVRGKIVLPGMIDTHAHIYRYVTGRFGLDADMVGVQSGVTALIDQGGASCMTFPGFRHFVAEPAATRCFAFISAYLVGGLEGHYYPQLYSPEGVDVAATVAAAKANRDLVKGVKAHAEIGGFARWGTRVMELGAQIGRDANLPVYVHFGQLWSLPPEGANGVDADTIVERTVALLRPGDILAHPFTRHPGGFVDKSGKVHPIVRAAIDMGLKIDVGHGSHFSYKMARRALDAGVVPHTLGADMHGYNTFLPPPPGTPTEHPDEENHPFAGQARFSLSQAMSSMLALGLTLQQVVPMVTSNAAVMAGMPNEIGALKPGMAADVSVLDDLRGRFKLQDNERTVITAERLLEPAFCLRAGRRYDATAPILPRAVAA
ncbi:MAG TPA: amidohydrolase/deacetylase family metallohydrolase [Xanthobacteraceae bacterium]|nr:amidohydrolase/deacetylase family metallohydrolase [Xanthobacteraceae bacterium]